MAKKVSRKKAPRKVDDDVTQRPRLPIPPVIGLGEVLGQPKPTSVIQRALSSGRVHHAWLLHGPPGVGKCTTALAFAAALLDPEAGPNLSGEFQADPDSTVGQLVRSGGHPELQVIRKELAAFHPDPQVRDRKQRVIPVDVIRHFLIEPASKTASMKGGVGSKVFIVDEAELMNPQSQNALLKTLEEPPPGTVVMLVTSSEDRLLPTIRSRCQRVGFGKLDEDSMRGWFLKSGLAVEPREERWLLEFGAGSPGAVITAHESGLFAWWNEIEPMLSSASTGRAPARLGITMAGLVDGWATEWAKGGEKGLEVRSKEAANRAGTRRMLSLIGHHAQQKLREDDTRGWAVHAVEAIGRAEQRSSQQVQPALTLEGLASELASL